MYINKILVPHSLSRKIEAYSRSAGFLGHSVFSGHCMCELHL